MTGQRYIEVLLPHVRLFRGAVGDKFVFMDDNATCHRTLAVQDCLDSEGIQRLVWPARSPDLNPIENVWDALGRKVAGRNYPPTNKNTLIRALAEEWDKLPQQLLDNVVQTVPKRAYDYLQGVHVPPVNPGKSLNRCANHTCAQLCFPTRTSYACKCSTDYEKVHSGCKIVTTTPPPPPTPEPTCPKDYCKHGAKCIVSGGEYFCHCPSEFQGEKCELQTAAAQGVYDYSWVVGLVVAVFSFGTVVSIIILCRMNRERLTRARERVAVTFRNTGWIRSSGRLVMDTDDGGACDELVSGKKGSFKQTRFTNPLFAKKTRVVSISRESIVV
ncbi:low-density lipoprotein receptor-related protein 2 [Trichonephila clavipes]|nr:low-density lipoprotein receptor-related protein 2 [Trichonephila clavipes]